MYIPVKYRFRQNGSHFRYNQRRSHRRHLRNLYQRRNIRRWYRTSGRNRRNLRCQCNGRNRFCLGGVGRYFSRHNSRFGSMTNLTHQSVRNGNRSRNVRLNSRRLKRPRNRRSSHNAFSSTGNHKTPSRISCSNIHRLRCHRPFSSRHNQSFSGNSPTSVTNRRLRRQVWCSSRYCSISSDGRTFLTWSQSATRSRSGRSRNSHWKSRPTTSKVKSYYPQWNRHSKNGYRFHYPGARRRGGSLLGGRRLSLLLLLVGRSRF